MNDKTLAALERLLKTHEERCLTAGVYAKDAALIRAHIETLRSGGVSYTVQPCTIFDDDAHVGGE